MYLYFSDLSSWIKCWEMLLHSCVNLVISFTSWHTHIHLLSTFGSLKCHPRMKRAQLVGYGTLGPEGKALVPYSKNLLILNISSYSDSDWELFWYAKSSEHEKLWPYSNYVLFWNIISWSPNFILLLNSKKLGVPASEQLTQFSF